MASTGRAIVTVIPVFLASFSRRLLGSASLICISGFAFRIWDFPFRVSDFVLLCRGFHLDICSHKSKVGTLET
ncbi:MAG TPA: hypothetical protein VKA15_20080, partial [Isosphaeraceae bacterium]|nr:hypothetical protein [Isosphaeraceae bacterium]